MTNKQLSFSDVTIKKINLISQSFLNGHPYDLIPHLREINIYENIFSNSLKANITLDEAMNLPQTLPIVGEEYVEIDITIPGMSEKYNDDTYIVNPISMFVHKITNQKLKTPQSQSLSLELVSESYMNNIHSRISKSYNDKKAGGANGIVRDIYFRYLDPILRKMRTGIFEPTKYLEECVIPNWTPFQAINWLARRSISSQTKDAANFVFYETLQGHYFRSLTTMSLSEPVLIFALEPAKVDPKKVERFSRGIVACDAIEIAHQPEMIKNINRGCYASTLITHDIVTKKIQEQQYNLRESWNDVKHLNSDAPVNFNLRPLLTGIDRKGYGRTDYDPQGSVLTAPNISFAPIKDGQPLRYNETRLSDCYDSAVYFKPKHSHMYAVKPDHVYDNNVEDWKLQRNSQMTLFDGLKFNVQCGGIPFLRVGAVVEIYMMSPQSNIGYESKEDTKLSGRCLVTAIRHVITNNFGNTEYKLWVELSMDSVQRDGIGAQNL